MSIHLLETLFLIFYLLGRTLMPKKQLEQAVGAMHALQEGMPTLELGLLVLGFEPTPHLETWTEETLYQEGVGVANAIAEYFGVSEEPLFTDSEFDDSIDSADLRANTGRP